MDKEVKIIANGEGYDLYINGEKIAETVSLDAAIEIQEGYRE